MGRRIGFSLTLVASMAAATSLGPMLGLLGTELLAEFNISRGQLGLLIGVSMFIGGACSPLLGTLTDRLGGRKALAVVFASASLAYAVLGTARVYALMLVASFFGGIANGLTNPATNKLIATEIAPGQRALITGAKQSGVQVGTALLGLLVPLGVLTWGWRPTVLLAGGVWLSFLPVTFRVTEPVPVSDRKARVPWGAAFRDVWPISVYGMLLGVGASVVVLLPLFAEESLGLDRIAAGQAAALAAITAIVGRMAWARRAERKQAFPATLRTIALLTVLAAAGLAASTTTRWLIWPAAALIGMSAGSWNSVGMLATIVTAGPARAGAATGWVLLGFLSGSGVSTPIFGWLVDRTGSYLPTFAAAATAAMVGSLVATKASTTPSVELTP
jgi:MFS family permease